MDVFASRLRERAAELEISISEAARRCGLSERRFSNYSAGNREPDLATLVRIAAALQTTPNHLLEAAPLVDDDRRLILDRLRSAGAALSSEDVSLLIVQAEAIAQYRRSE